MWGQNIPGKETSGVKSLRQRGQNPVPLECCEQWEYGNNEPLTQGLIDCQGAGFIVEAEGSYGRPKQERDVIQFIFKMTLLLQGKHFAGERWWKERLSQDPIVIIQARLSSTHYAARISSPPQVNANSHVPWSYVFFLGNTFSFVAMGAKTIIKIATLLNICLFLWLRFMFFTCQCYPP